MARYRAGSFKDAIDRFAVRTATKAELLHDAVAAQVFTSIVFGSEVTGAPGQPVEEGDLRSSWTKVKEAPQRTKIATDSPYAQSNEDGIARPGGGPYTLRSKVGGRHSVALTIASFPAIVAKANRELNGSAGGAP